MKAKFKPNKPVTKSQYPKFFSMLRKAAQNLGFDTPEEVENYRHQVMREEAGCDSIKQLNRKADFDACIKRFSVDSGDYAQAVEIGLQDARRRAYILKVLCFQIMQLKGGSESEARSYLEGVAKQSRITFGNADDGYWMDVPPSALRSLICILDKERLRLQRAAFPDLPTKFNDTVRFEINGNIRTRYTDVPKGYYSSLPFKVNVVS